MPSLFPEPSASAVSRPRSSSASWVVAHCDGGARGNPGPAGYGAVIHTEAGEKLAELSEFLGNRTNNFAEYSGLLGVLAWALANQCPRLRVVSDSELMVKQIQGRYKVNSPDLKPLWAEARARIARLDEFQISHALRHKNKEADRLANEAMDRGMGRSARSTEPPARSVAAAPIPMERNPGEPIGQRPSSAAREPNPVRATPDQVSRSTTHAATAGAMLRGFTRDGVVHLLGGVTLPDGVFVKVVLE